MRRTVVAVSSLVILIAVGVVAVGPALSQKKPLRPDLVVSAVTEPPSFPAAGDSFKLKISVANVGRRRAAKSVARAFFSRTPNASNLIALLRNHLGISRLGGGAEQVRTKTVRIPPGLANGAYFLIVCADRPKKLRERREGNNCIVSGQTANVGGSPVGPQGPPGAPGAATTTIPRTTLEIGRATEIGFGGAALGDGDDERSTMRTRLYEDGNINVVLDCKRTTNGENAGPDVPFAGGNTNFDEDGDEAKILVYNTGPAGSTVTYNGPGSSSRRNLGPGQGSSVPSDTNGDPGEESVGGEGKHMALATARDPEQAAPERDWVTAYKIGTIYIAHSNGAEYILTVYVGIDVLGVGDRCVAGGTLQIVRG